MIYKFSKKHKDGGFTLIEVIIYCTVFIMFAIVSIQMMIWVEGKLRGLNYKSEQLKQGAYNLMFSTVYRRLSIKNYTIESDYPYLVASSTLNIFDFQNRSSSTEIFLDNFDYGIVSNKNNGSEVFNSINFAIKP